MKVTLRKKKLLNGNYSYYLDIYHQGKRKYQTLGMYTSKDRQHNKEIQKLAEQIRNKTELELSKYGVKIIYLPYTASISTTKVKKYINRRV